MIIGVTQMDLYERFKGDLIGIKSPRKFLFRPGDKRKENELREGKMAYSPILGQLLGRPGDTDQISIPVYLFYSAKEGSDKKPEIDQNENPISKGVLGTLDCYISYNLD